MYIPEHITPELKRLQEIVNNSGEEGLFLFPRLSDDDFKIFGMYIQIYNYIEINLRRSIEVFCRASILTGNIVTTHPQLASAHLIGHLIIAVKKMNLTNNTEIISNLTEINDRHDFRHLLAHWAARRFPNDDAVILFTKNGREIKKIPNQSIANDSITTVILTMADLRGLLVHINQLEIWLAQKTSEWHKQYISPTQ
jgi:hypothetical protein